ncbi:MAG TPA: UbiA family prenyltransferase [Pyrinomonadaceae bacterium]
MNINTLSLRSPSIKATLRAWSFFRLPEIIALQGSPLLGFALAVHQPTMAALRPLLLLVVANLFLVAHIFLINDWAEMNTDLADPNRANNFLGTGGMSRNEFAGLTTVLLVLSLFLFSLLGSIPLCLALAITTASALYSLPQFHWKGKPVLSSLLHVVGGALHFLLGYSVVGAIETRALSIAVFFALTFAAGHLIQELRDYQSDVQSEIKTNAAIFGPRRTFVASLILFTMAQGFLCYLALRGTLPRPLAILIVLYPLQLYWSLTTLADGLTYQSIRRLQSRYRGIYALIGLVMLIILWSNHPA